MLSVVIATHDSEGRLLATLAALVAGAAAGMVREVIIADGGSRDATAAIADAAGCRLITVPASRGGRLRAAADAARGEWLLFLQPGVVPDASWIDETRRFVRASEPSGRTTGHAAVFRAAAVDFQPVLVEALTLLRAALRYRSIGSHGLLIARPFYRSLGGHREVDEPEADLLRRLGRRRITLLRTTAVAATT